jgi:hypothetical protein
MKSEVNATWSKLKMNMDLNKFTAHKVADAGNCRFLVLNSV